MSILALRHPIEVEPTYTVRVSAPDKWLNANDSGGWTRHHRTIKLWREMTGWAVTRTHLPSMSKAYILAELRFKDRRHRDPNNWSPTVKACIDGLVDAGVLPDDDSSRLIGPDLRLGPTFDVGNGAVFLHIWPVTS